MRSFWIYSFRHFKLVINLPPFEKYFLIIFHEVFAIIFLSVLNIILSSKATIKYNIAIPIYTSIPLPFNALNLRICLAVMDYNALTKAYKCYSCSDNSISSGI
jgi:hypothetical protein